MTARSGAARDVERRRGVVLVVVLVALAVSVALFSAMLRLTLLEQQSQLQTAWRLQAAWLAEAGIERAAWRLHNDPDYAGEQWIPAAEQLGSSQAASVQIEIEPVPDRADRRIVRVTADYPADDVRRARRSQEALLTIHSLGE